MAKGKYEEIFVLFLFYNNNIHYAGFGIYIL